MYAYVRPIFLCVFSEDWYCLFSNPVVEWKCKITKFYIFMQSRICGRMRGTRMRVAICDAERLALEALRTMVAEENNRLAQQIFLKPANICGYLVRPVEQELLDKLLEKAWHAIEECDGEKLVVRQRGVVHAIPWRKICYLESRGHQIFIHTFHERVQCYDRLENMKECLPWHFQQCHKSYLVNFDNVRRIERNRIVLKTGEEIPISRAKYALVRAAYSQYAGKEQEETDGQTID